MPADPFRDQDGRKADELARALAARREQFLFRLSVALASLLVFNVFTGWPIALAWFAAYAAIQMVERRLLYDLPVGRLTRGRRRTGLAVVAASNAVFSGLGIFEALHGGPWGLVCAVMLWSGSILNGASVGAASRAMVLASNTPPALCLLAAPFLVIYEEAPAAYGLAIVAAGVLNVLAATAIWEISSRLLEAKDAEHQARAIAFGDPETGLPNRMALEQEAALFRPGDDNVYLVALGVDRFNRIRGAIGHELAASLIGEVAGRLGALHSASRVARLSTDTLGLALAAADMDAAKARAAKLQASIAGPMAIGPHTVDVSLTIGIAEMGAAAAAAPGLVEGAAVALDAARAAKQRIACFDATSRVGAVDDLSLMSEMERAIAEDRLSLHYQPKYDLRAGVFVGAEALVRWHHPERGPMLPDAFVPVAEETGHIGALTRWVLAKAIEEQALLARPGTGSTSRPTSPGCCCATTMSPTACWTWRARRPARSSSRSPKPRSSTIRPKRCGSSSGCAPPASAFPSMTMVRVCPRSPISGTFRRASSRSTRRSSCGSPKAAATACWCDRPSTLPTASA